MTTYLKKIAANKNTHRILFIVFLAVLILSALWLSTVEIEGEFRTFVSRWGYIGFVLAAFLGGLNFIIPFSHIPFIVPLLNIGFDPRLLVALSAAGITLADAVGYGLGHSGSHVFSERLSHFRRRVERIITHHPRLTPWAILVWASFVPLPNEIFVIPAGIVHYGFFRTLFLVLLGNIISSSIIISLGTLIAA